MSVSPFSRFGPLTEHGLNRLNGQTEPTNDEKRTLMSNPDDELDNELPPLPVIDKGPPPECQSCGEPMSFVDGDWACIDCNGELMGPETG